MLHKLLICGVLMLTPIAAWAGVDQTTAASNGSAQVPGAMVEYQDISNANKGQRVDSSHPLPVTTTPGATTTLRIMDIPTVQNAAYSSGNCVGGFRSVTLTTNAGVGGLLQSVKITSISGGTEALTLYVFASNPSGSTCTDKGTFTLANADADKVIGVPTALTLSAATGATATFGFSGSNATPFVEGDSTASGVATVYYALVAGGSFTPPTTSDLHVSLGVVMDRP